MAKLVKVKNFITTLMPPMSMALQCEVLPLNPLRLELALMKILDE
jgi:hypothetical protein